MFCREYEEKSINKNHLCFVYLFLLFIINDKPSMNYISLYKTYYLVYFYRKNFIFSIVTYFKKYEAKDIVVVSGYRLVWYNSRYVGSKKKRVVVSGYRLVWYNTERLMVKHTRVVVSGYRLVWYNLPTTPITSPRVVVSGYRLVWYNSRSLLNHILHVVVSGYRLVWYNFRLGYFATYRLLFPVIAWYGIISGM